MSDIVKSSPNASAPTTRKRQPKNVKGNAADVLLPDAKPLELDPVGTRGLEDDAILVADAELASAVRVYDDRRNENVNRFFQHVRTTQQRTSAHVKQVVNDVYGLTTTDIYGGADSDE